MKTRAFTIIEMLIVVLIIVILTASVVAIGSQMRESAKHRQTFIKLKITDSWYRQYLEAGNPEPGVLLSFAPTAFLQSDTSVYADAWGNPIRFVPSTRDTSGNPVRSGYFQSAGSDGVFFAGSGRNDDIYSYDPQ